MKAKLLAIAATLAVAVATANAASAGPRWVHNGEIVTVSAQGWFQSLFPRPATSVTSPRG